MLQAHKMGQSTVRFGRANAAYVNIQIHQYEVVLCTYNPSRITNATLTWTQLQQKGTALRGDERGVCEKTAKKIPMSSPPKRQLMLPVPSTSLPDSIHRNFCRWRENTLTDAHGAASPRYYCYDLRSSCLSSTA